MKNPITYEHLVAFIIAASFIFTVSSCLYAWYAGQISAANAVGKSAGYNDGYSNATNTYLDECQTWKPAATSTVTFGMGGGEPDNRASVFGGGMVGQVDHTICLYDPEATGGSGPAYFVPCASGIGFSVASTTL